MVVRIREIEQALGQPEKRPTQVELAGRARLRRIVVAVETIPPGGRLDRSKVAFLRPDLRRHRLRRAVSTWDWPEIDGRRVGRTVKAGAAISREHLERPTK